jgi:hypothetical protein
LQQQREQAEQQASSRQQQSDVAEAGAELGASSALLAAARHEILRLQELNRQLMQAHAEGESEGAVITADVGWVQYGSLHHVWRLQETARRWSHASGVLHACATSATCPGWSYSMEGPAMQLHMRLRAAPTASCTFMMNIIINIDILTCSGNLLIAELKASVSFDDARRAVSEAKQHAKAKAAAMLQSSNKTWSEKLSAARAEAVLLQEQLQDLQLQRDQLAQQVSTLLGWPSRDAEVSTLLA